MKAVTNGRKRTDTGRARLPELLFGLFAGKVIKLTVIARIIRWNR